MCAGQKFNLKDGKFYCAEDYVKIFCKECRHCKQKIPTGSVIQVCLLALCITVNLIVFLLFLSPLVTSLRKSH